MNSGSSPPGPDTGDTLARRLARRLDTLAAPRPWWVAYSGGADSLSLLHALVTLGQPVHAIHVDHGLRPDSARWAATCRDVAAALGVPLTVERVQVRPAGDGPEAAARRARYDVFERVITHGGTLLTAHHRDDQAETVLLQLLRGTGLAGLAGMPVRRRLGAGWLVRPLLDEPRAALRRHAAASGLAWIEDPSNRDTGFDRNFLRQRVLPLLAERWPKPADRVHRAARHTVTAVGLLERLADRVIDPGSDTLAIATLVDFPPDERMLLVRHWLHRRGFRPPGERRLARGLDDLLSAAADRDPALTWPGGELRRHDGRLHLLPPRRLSTFAPLCGRGAEAVSVPEVGHLTFVEVPGGLGAARLAGGWELHPRAGGERLRCRGRTRTVKKLLQEAGLPPWEKAGYPLLFIAGEPVAVPGVAVADACCEHPGLMPVWTPAWRR